MITCLIVDDNPIARITLKQLASQISEVKIMGECASAIEAYNILQDKPVDLLLLDIEMPGISGLELTKTLGGKKPVIVFTTSKKEYAAEAFELNVADYIVKPVTPARFMMAIEKVTDLLQSREQETKFSEDEVIFIRDSNIVRKLKLDELLYAEAMGDYVKLFTGKKFYAVHTTLKAVEERLLPAAFIRIHRSYIVAINKIETIREGAIIIDGKSLPVADAYRSALNKRMNIL